ncbi:sprouty-related, EVH1 domain-containing protein 1 isoform X1 [Anopheles arabiensis]|uniref:sprouty-related, EVH1 domain-containing protein 1 isoform X1 n=1 Tax=Anopheles arabiensis TaxID=7173 RepID=UPI001AAC7BDC|nr:sprouty-related, EVH1 domain-containing protein 1 isoform X1 [Anopheles arabiensis]XP_040164375.1 sprouty-related, EVH1 domain-containing protein 1 isoform X1 [Anopheles arabiensis]XP_040164376.1 sprouty-related, EVH1 domain-containing protein 1 isoform X1 [Anopheles arabiensis]
MTEAYEDDFLVRVRAQVMARDESTEGWLPLQGGGLANVSIRKRARLPPDGGGHEYIIYGQRISDQTVILSCVINRDLQYFKVMPTFHHWRAGKQRNGLTFQTAADARAFDKGIIRAYDDLIDGMADATTPNTSNRVGSPHPTGSSDDPATELLLPLRATTAVDTDGDAGGGYNDDDNDDDETVGEDDVFMTLDLPIEPSESRSNSEGSGSHQSVDKQSQQQQQQQQSSIQYISGDKPSPLISSSKPGDEKVTPLVPGDNYSYVQITDQPCDIKLKYNFYHLKVHDYNYPVIEEPPIGGSLIGGRRDSTSSLKKRNALDAAANAGATSVPPIMKEGTLIKTRLRCRYCQEFYNDEWNHKGSCDYAPDCVRTAIENVSGMPCARCMLYHCMKDSEGETASHPCLCTGESGCTKRWIGLTLLSLLVPCLWCYPPLRACHWIGVHCRLCGGKHKPQI